MSNNPLGQSSVYPQQYAPELLYKILREDKRRELDKQHTHTYGEDIWNLYEVSWLNPNGLPQVAIGEIRITANSLYMPESKSLKLYLNSLNQQIFNSLTEVQQTIQQDLAALVQSSVQVCLLPLDKADDAISRLHGKLIDHANTKIEQYQYCPQLLENAIGNQQVEEMLVSHLLRSNCLITQQPDWGTIQIKYQGKQIDHSKLLQYLVSFRLHNEFHEQCVERIFADIKSYCMPNKLTVYARYSRRGGIDINPWRSNFEKTQPNLRLVRQ